ncbi:MAG: hypothetical protein J2P36_30630, partial [Ktedonobacteraceae bacterium]|nr:hypothetical protein [Ktedonobacteraceae bacterium]
TPTATSPPVGSVSLRNGGFEEGNTGWQEYSSHGYELVDSINAHSGHYGAFLCGYGNCNDVIAQSFTVPVGSSHIEISYWLYGKASSTTKTCRDTFIAQVLDSKGRVIVQLQPRVCNADVVAQWKQVTFDASKTLSGYAGQRVTLMFGGRTSLAYFATAFFVDDVAVVVR